MGKSKIKILLPVRCPNCNFLNKFSVRDYEQPKRVIDQISGLPCQACQQIIYSFSTGEARELKLIKEIIFATQRADFWNDEIARLEKEYYEMHCVKDVEFLCKGGSCHIK